MLLLTLVLPALAAAWIAWREFPRSWPAWKPHVITIALLAGAGWFASRPFLRGTWVGTGESYNYSLSIADAVTQFRSGHFPAFVGETEFAFNGRIHPLRTAPYYCYAAGALDLLTLHRLDFWELQDLLIALSITGGAFSAYVALRYLAGVGREGSRFLAILFIVSPAVMSVTYSMDLYMTVTTLPYLPLVFGAAVLTFRERSLRAYLLLGSLGGLIWLVHPPIALWVSPAIVAIAAVPWFTARPTLRAAAAALAGAIAGIGLAVFSFASTLTMQEASSIDGTQNYTPLFDSLRNYFGPSLLPVSAGADKLGDFQLGYVFWGLLLGCVIVGLWRRILRVVVLVVVTAGILLFLLPIPRLMQALWNNLPPVVPNVTNIWPMQRLYLVSTAILLLASGLSWREFEPWYAALPGPKRKAFNFAVLAALAWTGWEAQVYINRGFLLRRAKAASEQVHRPENVDMTVTSYAMFTLPPRFVHGVEDASRDFRLLKADSQAEIANNWTSANPGTVRARGTMNVVGAKPDQLPLSGIIKILPGRRYVLDLIFQAAPFPGTLLIEGEKFARQYYLPSAGEKRAFGMLPENSHSLFLWTTNPAGEELRLRIAISPGNRAAFRTFADYVLSEIAPENYPVQVEQWSPLRGKVTAPEDSWLETPRRFIPGYAATVDGKPVDLRLSPDTLVMIRVPAGAHAFEVSYPGSPVLRRAFWTTFAFAAGLLLIGAGWVVQHRLAGRRASASP